MVPRRGTDDDRTMNTTPPGPPLPPPLFGAPPPPPPAPPRAPHRPPWRLVRREHGRILGGVATGMAKSFGIDLTLVRVIWIVAAIGGIGIPAYIICWVAFPSDEQPAPITQIPHQTPGYIVGLVLLGVGLMIVFGQVLSLSPLHHGLTVAWAAVLIGGGLAVLLLRHPDDEPPDDPYTRDKYANPEPVVTNEAPSAAATETTTETGVPEPGADSEPTATTATAVPTTTAWSQQGPWGAPPPPWPHRPRRPRRPRARPFLTPLTLSVLLIGGGVVWLLDNNGTAHFTAAEILAGGLGIVGLALVLSAWFGRTRGLIPLGILLLLVTLPAATIDVPITGGTGNRNYQPVTRSEIQSKYELGIGRLEVDLTHAPLTRRTTRIRARLGIGEMAIDVPSTVRVVAHAHAGAGSINLFGLGDDGGWPSEKTRTAPGSQTGVLYLDLRVGAGHVEVRRFDPSGAETNIPGGN